MTELEKYLKGHVNDVFLMRPDRKEFIRIINARKDGHLKKSIEYINKKIKDENLSYKIKKFCTSRSINGIR